MWRCKNKAFQNVAYIIYLSSLTYFGDDALHVVVLSLNQFSQKVVAIGTLEHVTLSVEDWYQVIRIFNSGKKIHQHCELYSQYNHIHLSIFLTHGRNINIINTSWQGSIQINFLTNGRIIRTVNFVARILG